MKNMFFTFNKFQTKHLHIICLVENSEANIARTFPLKIKNTVRFSTKLRHIISPVANFRLLLPKGLKNLFLNQLFTVKIKTRNYFPLYEKNENPVYN